MVGGYLQLYLLRKVNFTREAVRSGFPHCVNIEIKMSDSAVSHTHTQWHFLVYHSVPATTLAHFADELAAFSTLRALADSVSFSLQALLVSSPSGMREGAPVFLSVCPLSPPPPLCRFSPFALSAVPSVFLAVSFRFLPPRSS